MDNIDLLHPGEHVRIVSEWPPNGRQNGAGKMDKWLGQIMTVREVNIGRAGRHTLLKMVEDAMEFRNSAGDGWSWFPEMIECVIDDDCGDAIASDSELSDFLGI